MTRADALLLAGLLLAGAVIALPVHADEALDAGEAFDEEFLDFLAEEAQDAAQGETDHELVAWLRDWWTPADDSAGVHAEEKP